MITHPIRTEQGDLAGIRNGQDLYVICRSCHMMITTEDLRRGFLNPTGDLMRCRDTYWDVKPDSIQPRLRVLLGGRL